MIHRVLVIQNIEGVALFISELELSLLLARAPLELIQNYQRRYLTLLALFQDSCFLIQYFIEHVLLVASAAIRSQ